MKRQINTETPFAKILKIWRSLELKSLRNAKFTLTKLTSILKVLLKQYMSPTGPNKYLGGITPIKTDHLELHLFKVKISKDCIEKSGKLN